MAKVIEVDEREYNQMVALRGVAARIVAKPESRRLLEQAQKLVDPNASTPMLDEEARAIAPLTALKTEMQAKIDALQKERDDEKREATLAAIAQRQTADFSKLRKEGYTDEGIAAVQKLMEDEGITKVSNAVAIFERNNPPQMPSTPQGGMTGTSWGFADVNENSDKMIQDLINSKGNNEALTDRMAAQALQDFRSRR
jgi:hypothetical protein